MDQWLPMIPAALSPLMLICPHMLSLTYPSFSSGILSSRFGFQCCGDTVVPDSSICCGDSITGKAYDSDNDRVCCGEDYVLDDRSVCCVDDYGNKKVRRSVTICNIMNKTVYMATKNDYVHCLFPSCIIIWFFITPASCLLQCFREVCVK